MGVYLILNLYFKLFLCVRQWVRVRCMYWSKLKLGFEVYAANKHEYNN